MAGILLGELEGTTAVVHTRVVAPGYHVGWVNVMLLAEALDIGWAHGARRARFSYTDSNQDTQKLAKRFRTEIISVIARFVRSGLKERTADSKSNSQLRAEVYSSVVSSET